MYSLSSRVVASSSTGTGCGSSASSRRRVGSRRRMRRGRRGRRSRRSASSTPGDAAGAERDGVILDVVSTGLLAASELGERNP